MSSVKTDLTGLIDGLADDLTPVRPVRMVEGLLAVGFAVLATVLAVHVIEGLWDGIVTGRASTFFMITNGLLLVLGLASATSVISMANPGVGNNYKAAKWALLALAVVPIATIIHLAGAADPAALMADRYGPICTASSLAAATLTGAALVVWLRRGAPVSLKTAGWQTGLAAGSLGTLAYGLSCPLDGAAHLGIYHIAPVAIAALIGAVAVPKLVRW